MAKQADSWWKKESFLQSIPKFYLRFRRAHQNEFSTSNENAVKPFIVGNNSSQEIGLLSNNFDPQQSCIAGIVVDAQLVSTGKHFM